MYKTITDTAIWIAIFLMVAVFFSIKYGHESSFRKAFVWLIWDFSGLRFIVGKIFPQDESQKKANPPATITLWVIAVYSAFFGIASVRYENAVDIIENRANAFNTQIAVIKPKIRKTAWAEVSEIQNIKCPVKPEILKPSTIIYSLIKSQTHENTIELLIRTVQKFKDNLQDASLLGANLQGARLNSANLQRAIMIGANLQGADLKDANLEGAELGEANLQGAMLSNANLIWAELGEANLQGAILSKAKLQGAIMFGANLQGAMLILTNLQGAQFLTCQQLCSANTLRLVTLDSKLAVQVFFKCRELLQDPFAIKSRHGGS